MSSVLIGEKEYFKGIEKITFEGRKSKNPLAFKYYNPSTAIMGKSMADHFKFAVAYWHSFCNTGVDPFGDGPKQYPWDTSSDVIRRAKDKADAAFEFYTKLGVEYFCFHDVDLIDEGDASLLEYGKRLNKIANYTKQKMEASGVKLLWGTANLFSHPRYMNGAATNPDFNVVAYAAAQVKNAIDATIKLEGENYVFWGGREGYMSLLNTNMKRELDHMAQFLHNAKNYARSQGFKGTFFIEPKPMEPSKHQYDFDAATVIGFLRAYDLDDDFKLNLETNHATLANHTMEHEVQVAVDNNMLGSMDANRGDYQNGWDTDQFPVDLYELTQTCLILLESDGFQGGGINFDAKTRRNSTDLDDLFIAHIGGMDAFARSMLIAEKILAESDYRAIRKNRYASFASGNGALFEAGNLSLIEMSKIAHESNNPQQISGKQEMLEYLINQYI